MGLHNRARWAFTKLVLASIGLLIPAHAALASDPSANCSPSAEDASLQFIERGVRDPQSVVPLLRPRAVKPLRARLEQLLDDRYAPGAKSFRERLLGPSWSMAALRAATDEQLVGEFLAAGLRQRPQATLANLKVVRLRKSAYLGDLVTVSYQLDGVQGHPVQERTLSTFSDNGCWSVDVPDETWARLTQLASELKRTRPAPLAVKPSRERLPLVVGEASAVALEGLKEVPRPASFGHNLAVWVSRKPVLSEKDVVAASANWDCEAGLGPEEVAVRIVFSDAAARRMAQWSEQHLGTPMAVVIDGRAWVYAKIAGKLGGQISVCLPGMTLEGAETMAKDISGT